MTWRTAWSLLAAIGLLAGALAAPDRSLADAIVADQFARRLVRIDLQTGAQTTLARRGSIAGPRGQALLDDGTLLVANEAAATIVAIDPSTGVRRFVWGPDRLGPPISLRWDGQRFLYVGTAQFRFDDLLALPAIVRLDLLDGSELLLSQGGLLKRPSDLTIGADGQLYVADPTAAAVLRIDVLSGTQTRVSPPDGLPPAENILGTPNGIDTDAEGALVVASDNVVLRVDAMTGAQTLITGSSLLPAPRGLRIATDGFLHTVDRITDNLLRIHPINGTQVILARGGLLDGSAGLALAPTGEIFVSSLGDNAIVRVNRAAGTVRRIVQGPSLELPYALASKTPGIAFVADGDGQRGAVVRVDLTSGEQLQLSLGGLLRFPQGMAIGSDGRLLVPDLINRAVIAVDPETGEQSVEVNLPLGAGPAGIAVSDDGALWIGDRFRNAVVRVDPVTKAQAIISRGGSLEEPNALAFDRDGFLLVSDSRNIVRVDPVTGEQSLAAEGTAEQWLFGLAPMEDGSILTTDGTGAAVVEVDAQGTLTPVSAEGVLNFPTGLAMIAVPEPGAIPGGLAAGAALALAARRRAGQNGRVRGPGRR